MKNIFLFLSLFLLCIYLGKAQETIIKHTVEKGETVFQLSRKYNTTPEEIYRLNPSAVDLIKIGEVLSIPSNENQNQSSYSPTSNSTNSNTITYAVVYGDTKYSLARRYGISVEELERQNPHTRNGLQAGHILKINGQATSAPSKNITIAKTHLVLKGETLWGISKANGLTVEELVYANSDILNGILQIGQVLKIPTPSNGNFSNSETYLVQKGDTKYGLSKKYGVTIAELEQANPNIVRMLMAGTTIRIPGESDNSSNESSENNLPEETEVTSIPEQNEEPVEQSVPTDTDPISETNTTNQEVTSQVEPPETTELTEQSQSYENYEIQPKETLYGLSKKAGMSISDFVSLNPQLANGVQIGTIVKMPVKNSVQPQPIDTNQPTIKKSNSRYVDLSQSIKTTKKNRILLFLPFSESEFNTEYESDINFKDVSDNFLKEHLEFYRGAKIAQDSARAMGLDFTLQIVETNDSKRNSKAAELAKENAIETSDAVVLPFYENDIEEIATITKDKNIPVLTAGTAVLDQEFKNVFNSVPSLNAKRNVMLDYMMSQGGNIIVVCDVARKESKTYIENYAPSAKFVEVNKKGTFDSNDFESKFDTTKTNFVILESEKNSVFLSTTNLLLGQLSNYSIQLALLDKSLIPNTDDVSNKRFVILQMLYPSLTPVNDTNISSRFNDAYVKGYSVEPSQNVKYGFDLMYDTLLRTSQAKSFETSADEEITEYTVLKFDYKLNTIGGYDNIGIYIIQYNSDGTLKEVK